MAAADAELLAAQRALDTASGDSHKPVLWHAIDARIAAAAELDRAMLAVEKARARYVDAGELASLASLRGARHPHVPILSRGPYGKRAGEHAAAERAAWGGRRRIHWRRSEAGFRTGLLQRLTRWLTWVWPAAQKS